MTMMVRSFKLNIPDVVVAVLVLMLMAMANNEVAVNADIVAAPVGVGGHKSSDHMLVVADDNHRELHDGELHCENDPDFLYKGVAGKDCDSWALLKPDNCRKDQKDSDGNKTGKQVKFYCPQQCKSKCAMEDPTNPPTNAPTNPPTELLISDEPSPAPTMPDPTNPPTRGKCENDPDFLYKGMPGKDCDSWVPSKGDNCRKDQKDSDGKRTGKQVKFYCPQQCKSECMIQWPSEVYSAFRSNLNPYKGTTLDLVSGSIGTSGRPTTTMEAASNGWKPLQKECVPYLGYPWAFDGKITDGAPVTLYYSKETKKNEGVLTGLAVHYYDNIAPDTMIGSLFVKGDDYDTLQVAFHGKNTDVCGGGSLFSNDPYIALLLADGKGRKSFPMTEDAATASGEWAKGACIGHMGIHYYTDIENGSNLSLEAKYLFPIAPMYNSNDGSLNGIMFIATKPLQNWDIEKCGYVPFGEVVVPCLKETDLWDGSPLGLLEKLDPENYPGYPFGMCANLCEDNCYDRITGAAGGPVGGPPSFGSMHFFFKKSEDIATCATRC